MAEISEGCARQLTIRGPCVHEVGYRLFLLEAAGAFHVERFEVYNLVQDSEQTVVVRFGSVDADRVKEYEEYVRANYPEGVEVRTIDNSRLGLGALPTFERTALTLQTKQLYKGVAVIRDSSQVTNRKLDGISGKLDHGFKELGDKVDHGFKELGDKVDHGFKGLGDKMDHGFNELGDKVDHGFHDLGEKMDHGFKGLGDKMDHGFHGLGEGLGSKIDALPERIADAIVRTNRKHGS